MRRNRSGILRESQDQRQSTDGRESREGRYRNISSQTKEDGMCGAKIGMTMVGREPA
jgi:hypothetical protein